jgi:hypothetical protein
MEAYGGHGGGAPRREKRRKTKSGAGENKGTS